MTMHRTDNIDYKCQEKKEEEESPALNKARMHRYDDSKITLKRAKKD